MRACCRAIVLLLFLSPFPFLPFSSAEAQARPSLIPWPRQVRFIPGNPVRLPAAGPVVRVDPSWPDPTGEGYRLTVDSTGVTIVARTEAGAFYARQTLRQLTNGDGAVPRAVIEDAPRFRWRGMHLDVGRHLYPVEFIKRYIDLLARYKLNTFHWHLTDDQGWRLEIKAYPRLTEVGSCRKETVVARNFDPYIGDGIPYCGFYTQEQVREVVRYAAERHITVVPEIEMPGHAVAALAAYPELGCGPGPYEVWTLWGVNPDIFCPSEKTFAFLETVLTEVMTLFPSTFIHVGGDEAPKDVWKKSPLAQGIMRRERLRNEAQLQSWFMHRIDRFLTKHGRRMVGWDEILEGGLAPGATVMSWRGTDGGIAAARAGHDVVMTPTSHLYLDYYQGERRYEPLAGGGMVTLERVYSYDPVPPVLTAAQAKHILGAQGNVWTEYMKDASHVEYMVLPRMLAVAEVTWSPREARNWNSFTARLPGELASLDALGVNYRVPTVTGLEQDRLLLADTVRVTLGAPIGGATIRYTLDGTDPTISSPAYTAPLPLRLTDSGTVVTARAFREGGRSSPPRSARFRRGKLTAPVASPATVKDGLEVAYYEGKAERVADLEALPLRRRSVARQPSLLSFARREGWGARFTGLIRIPSDGVWTFRLSSDDGSRLWIGDELVVDFDGLHSADERTGSVALMAGLHPFRLDYFQAGGGRALSLQLQKDGTTVPLAGKLFH